MLNLKDLQEQGWRHGINKICCCDCLPAMRLIEDKAIDLILCDPPYGIGEDGGRFRDRKGGGHRVLPKGNWDKERVGKEYFNEIFRIAPNQIVFGGNYYTDFLPVSRGWIYWQKLMGGDFSDGELAWTSFDRVLKEFTYCNKYAGKKHPTQKPAELMRWILENYSNEGDLICDPFAGSFTTARACKDLGRDFIGFELSPSYCRIGEERLRQEVMF
jgi:site-specific DNA-methyltransferase (adenine-specific)